MTPAAVAGSSASSGSPTDTSGAGAVVFRNAAWSLVGNAAFAACQWGVVVVLARRSGTVELGRYALAAAVTAPIVLLFNCALRTVQAADVERRYAFADYLGFRTLSLAAAATAILIAAPIVAVDRATFIVLLIVGLGKLIEAGADLLHGLLWQRERLEAVGKSQLLRGAMMLGGALLATQIGGGAALVAAFGAVAALLVTLVYDLPTVQAALPVADRSLRRLLRPRWVAAQLKSLARLTLPLGVTVLLGTLIFNMPRYAGQNSLGTEALGVFAALAYFALAGNLVATSLAQAAMPGWSRLHAAGSHRVFRRAVARQAVGVGVLGLIGVLIAQQFGGPLLGLLYGPSFAAHGAVFTILMAATACGMVVCVLDHGLYAAQRFHVQVPLNLAVVAVTAVACIWATPHFGLVGAAWATLGSMAAGILLRMPLVFAGGSPSLRRADA